MDALERIQQMTDYKVGRLVRAGAVLGIYDVLEGGPMAASEVAAQVSTDPLATRRLLRALAAVGVLSESADGCFVNTELGDLLREGHPQSAKTFAVDPMDDRAWKAWCALPEAVRTGEVPYRAVNGGSVWSHLADDPVRASEFNAMMVVGAQRFAKTLIENFDFSRCRHIVDVGGGNGAVLGTILAAAPDARGTVFDLESGLVGTDRFLSDCGVRDRCDLVTGSFFESVTAGADLYVLHWILHDWPDDQAVEILSACRRAMTDPAAQLLVSDMLLPERAAAEDEARFLMDMTMFVMLGSAERTESEFRALLGATGFGVKGVLGTSPEETIVAVPL